MMLGELGVIQVSTGSAHEAAPTLVESVALTWDVRDDATLTRALRGLAAVAAVTDQPVAAAHLLGAADAVDASTPFAVVAAARDRDIVEWCLARLADHFDATALDRERRAGLTAELEIGRAGARGGDPRARRRARGRDLAGDRRARSGASPEARRCHRPADPAPAPPGLWPHRPRCSSASQTPVRGSGPPLPAFDRPRDRRGAVHLPRTVQSHVRGIFNKLGAPTAGKPPPLPPGLDWSEAKLSNTYVGLKGHRLHPGSVVGMAPAIPKVRSAARGAPNLGGRSPTLQRTGAAMDTAAHSTLSRRTAARLGAGGLAAALAARRSLPPPRTPAPARPGRGRPAPRLS